MKKLDFLESIKIFLVTIPHMLREMAIWLVISYIIPIINIGIIWGIKQSKFAFNLTTLNIILVTNACFLTALIYQVYTNEKKRKLINIIGICTLIITVVLFTVSIIEMEQKLVIFDLSLYSKGAWSTLIISILLGLISKYDEVKALSKKRANDGKEKKETVVGDKKVTL